MLAAGSFMLGCSEHEWGTVVPERDSPLPLCLRTPVTDSQALSLPPRSAHVCTGQVTACCGVAARLGPGSPRSVMTSWHQVGGRQEAWVPGRTDLSWAELHRVT